MHADNNREWRSLCTTVAQEGKQHRNLSLSAACSVHCSGNLPLSPLPSQHQPSPGSSSVPEPRLFPSAPRMELCGAGREQGWRKVPINHQLGLLEGLQRHRQRASSLLQCAKLLLTLPAHPDQAQKKLGTNGTSSPVTPQTTVSSEQEHREAHGGNDPSPRCSGPSRSTSHPLAPGCHGQAGPPAGPAPPGRGDSSLVPPSWAVG